MIPTNKISQTILEFGKVLILKLPENHSKDEFKMALRIAITAWNAVTIDSWGNKNEYEKKLLETLNDAPSEMKVMVKQLIKRKKKKFSSDPRAIGNHWIREEDGEFIFGCEARLDVKNVSAEGSVQ